MLAQVRRRRWTLKETRTLIGGVTPKFGVVISEFWGLFLFSVFLHPPRQKWWKHCPSSSLQNAIKKWPPAVTFPPHSAEAGKTAGIRISLTGEQTSWSVSPACSHDQFHSSSPWASTLQRHLSHLVSLKIRGQNEVLYPWGISCVILQVSCCSLILNPKPPQNTEHCYIYCHP